MTSAEEGRSSRDRKVRLPESTLRKYRRFSLHNSPYPAHDAGCAIDLYPASNEGRSPVAGEVIEARTVRAPSKPYASDEEYLLLVDVDREASGLEAAPAEGLAARILHVRPTVEAGDRIEVGEPLGPMIRSGFFAPWVANHVHVGFRRPEQNLRRANGSLPVDVGVGIDPVPWDGTGTVTEVGETYALLDAPEHPAPGDRFAGLAATSGDCDSDGTARSSDADGSGRRVVLDGGFAHYAAGGALGGDGGRDADGTVSWLGQPIGDRTGRTVAWRDVDVLANGERITGLSLFVGIDPAFGAKLVCPDRTFAVGETVRIALRESDEPIRLG